MKHEELMRRIQQLIKSVDSAYDCVAEHGRSGLGSIDNVKRLARDVELAEKLIAEEDRVECCEEIIRGYADRCPCHDDPFDPMNPEHEGRGPGECAQCEAAAGLLGR